MIRGEQATLVHMAINDLYTTTIYSTSSSHPVSAHDQRYSASFEGFRYLDLDCEIGKANQTRDADLLSSHVSEQGYTPCCNASTTLSHNEVEFETDPKVNR